MLSPSQSYVIRELAETTWLNVVCDNMENIIIISSRTKISFHFDVFLKIISISPSVFLWSVVENSVITTRDAESSFFVGLRLQLQGFKKLGLRPRLHACSNSHGKAHLNSLDFASITITNSSGLNTEPWFVPTFTLNYHHYHELF